MQPEKIFLTGLASVTFRQLTPRQIVDLAAAAGLDAIEWGGDVHVPHGDRAGAREARALAADAGLAVASYGSYYRAGKSEAEGLSFSTVLATAQALGAPVIRVWAGVRGSASATPEYRALIAGDLRRIGALAGGAGLMVALECHVNTLTDTAASAMQLLEEVGPAGVRTYWQPPVGRAVADCCADLRRLAGHLAHLHVHYFDPAARRQRPLAEGAEAWRQYLALAAPAAPARRYALLEFVAGGAPEQFLADAQTLRGLAAAAGGQA